MFLWSVREPIRSDSEVPEFVCSVMMVPFSPFVHEGLAQVGPYKLSVVRFGDSFASSVCVSVVLISEQQLVSVTLSLLVLVLS